MSSVTDCTSLAQLARRLNLVTDDQVLECMNELESRSASPESLLRIFERKAYLTPWQGSKLIKGDVDGYFLGGYRLLYRISSGTFGRVFRGDDPRTGEVVAIKVLRRRWTENPQKIELFEREGKLGMTLRHLNIVSILAVSKDAKTNQYFIVMEFVEGGTLKDFLQIRKKLEPKEALHILEESTNGLAYAFSRGLTHRDIKPSNILISASKVCKLVDFGLAELTGPMVIEDQSEVDQSVDYAGLEQATGCKPGDIRSDIYFLGCVFYQMLTGKPLLSVTKDLRARKNKLRFDVLKQIDRNDPDLPAAMYKLLSRMLVLDPTERYQTPAQLVEGIRSLRAELTGEALPDAGQPAGPKTVYVVEHNPKLQDVFREKLKEAGFRVLISIDAERAAMRYQQQPYHALIVDLGTAGEPGLDSFSRVMSEAGKMSLKCRGIVIASEDQEMLAEKARQTTEAVVLTRPVTLRQILQALNDDPPKAE